MPQLLNPPFFMKLMKIKLQPNIQAKERHIEKPNVSNISSSRLCSQFAVPKFLDGLVTFGSLVDESSTFKQPLLQTKTEFFSKVKSPPDNR